MEDKPLVNIRCLVYNHEPYLRQCLDGFVMQKTSFKFEAIVHDDASTDGSADIIREYAEKYPDIIKPIYETENQYSKHDGSLGRIMNEACQAKYVAFCEGDDYWFDPLKLQKQVDFLEANKEYALVYTDVNFYFQSSKKLVQSVFKNRIIKHEPNFKWHLINTGYFAPCTWVCRKEYIPLPSDRGYVDGTFPWLLDVLANSKIFFLPDTTTVYRKLDESASHTKDIDKILYFKKGVFQIQLEYAKSYNVSQNIIGMIKERYFENILVFAILNDSSTLLDKCSEFFLRTKPHLKRTRVLLFLSKFYLGRFLIKMRSKMK